MWSYKSETELKKAVGLGPFLWILFLMPLAVTLNPMSVRGGEAETPKIEFFEKTIRPIFVRHCHGCHAAETKPAGDLRVDDLNGLLTGGKSGPAIIPGKADKSLLIRRVSKGAKARMPAEGDLLTEEEIEALSKWINEGAAWPAVKLPVSFGKVKARNEELKKTHWAWQPLSNPGNPAVSDQAWSKHPVDRWIFSRLESGKLKPVGDADKLTLIRRLYFDLTGLPPTPMEIDAFLANGDREAYEKLVDRLLASPQFGEHWGRHWLDVARYGESTGPSRNIPYPHAWKYRDYVIESFNADIPYDQFIRDQIAGDILSSQGNSASSEKDQNRLKIATGFLALGVKDVNQRFKVRFQMDNVDEQIDAVTRSILGLTVSCARCHDHKFDPITQSDYYALAGIFTSTEIAAGVRSLMGGGGLDYYAPESLVILAGNLPPTPPEKLEKLKKDLAEAKKAWDAIKGTAEGMKIGADGYPVQRSFRLKYEKLDNEYKSLTDPAERGLATHGVRDSRKIGDTEIRIRGEAEKLGPLVKRGFLSTFNVPDAPPVDPSQSGRLQLALWLTSSNNPLTARVAVNRIWAKLFGQGIVSTVDNFGVTGAAPSHPELLDYLARHFMENGWSIKKLIRELVLTKTYRLSANSSEACQLVDPANTLGWRHSLRRLTAEEIRDSMLAIAGILEKTSEPSPVSKLKMIEMRDTANEAVGILEKADKSRLRSLYLPLIRGLTPGNLAAFDPVEQTLVTGNRDKTTVPSQALFMLNAPFVRQQAALVAESVTSEPGSDSERIVKAYRRVLGRTPTDSENRLVTDFLNAYREAALADPATAGQAVAGAWKAFVQSLFASAEFRYVP